MFARICCLSCQLWRDESGVLASIELILMGTIILLGSIVGLATYRDSIVQELGDASASVSSLQQGYEYIEVTQAGVIDNMQFSYSVAGSSYVDDLNFGELAVPDPAGGPAMCIVFTPTFDDEL